MKLIPHFGPKWKHPDPRVRAEALQKLEDQDILAQCAQGDADDHVRTVAFKRLTDPRHLLEIARSTHPFASEALEKIEDQTLIGRAARVAERSEVRMRAVQRVTDSEILHRVAAQDENAAVRAAAKKRIVAAESVQGMLRTVLEKLEVAERKAAQMAGYCGSLDDVCARLADDPRFSIDGIIGEVDEKSVRVARTRFTPDPTALPRATRVELIGGHKPASEGSVATVARPTGGFYRIAIHRVSADQFEMRVIEERPSNDGSSDDEL